MSSFDNHLEAVIAGNEKTASVNSVVGDDLLAKLAAEVLGYDQEGAAANGQAAQLPKAENHVSEIEAGSANPTVGASAEMTSAMDAVVTPAIAVAGADIAAIEAGEAPAAVVDSGDAATIGTGIPSDAKLKKEMGLAADQIKEAHLIGDVIAQSFSESLEKQASDEAYSDSLELLKEAGLLDSYVIQDEGVEKVASEQVSGLEKIAEMKELSHQDIINAASEYVDYVKTASEIEVEAREDARADAAQSYADDAIVKEASQKPEVVEAVKVLKANGIIS